MGYPHHIQSSMHGGSSIDPKFPPSTDDYHHSHHHHYHNGYGHATNSMSANMAPLSNNDYSNHQNVSNGMHSNNSNNYNYSQSISGHFYQHTYNSQMHPVPVPLPPNQPNNSAYSPVNNNSSTCYGSYYGSNNDSHQMLDMPLQCPSTEPTNTVLGLHELGKIFFCSRTFSPKIEMNVT